jgi:hypothetical protein
MTALAKTESQMADGDGNPLIGAAQTLIADCVDALDGATLTGSTLTTSATPTVDELEACVGVLGGKINAILDILEAHGLMKAS